MPFSEMSVDQRSTDGTLGVVLSTDTTRAAAQLDGELDRLSAPRLRGLLDHLVSTGYTHVELDVSRLGFLDAGGLDVLATAGERFDAVGGRLALVGATPWITRILRAVSLDGLLA